MKQHISNPTPKFFTKIMGEIQGPFTPAQIRTLAKTGRLLPDSHIRKGANGNWTTADRIKGLSFASTATAHTSPIAKQPPTLPNPPSAQGRLLVSVLAGVIAVLVVAISALTYLLLSRDSGPSEPAAVLTSSTTAPTPELSVSNAQSTAITNNSDKKKLRQRSAPITQNSAETVSESDRKAKTDRKAKHREWLKTHYGLSNYIVAEIGDTEVILGYNNSLVYVPEKDIETTSSISDGLDFKLGYRAENDEAFQDAIGNHIKINGETVHVPFESSDTNIAKVYDDGSCGLNGKGSCKVGVQLPNQKLLAITVETKSIPVDLSLSFLDSSSAADLVRLLGLPDKREKYSESWPDAVHKNGMTHVTSAGGVVRVEHWKYNKYPGLVLALRNGEHLEKIGTYFDPN